ncbi:TadE/TadG family type IV pilus assembly protein [Antribacter gilvus]|uniref:TadE/TadG family type IV pilus assembly protein n=1 Tax=Antribacter gilvus TaxID=2304675 RepID=UPI000F78B3C5|nr:pilus assembly protein TadG-related protein [Antribacter gilvus]
MTPSERSEEGSISTWAVLSAVVLTLCVGLAVDLGGQIHAKQRAHDIAAEAARTGAQQVAPGAMTGGPLTVDPAGAYWAATDYLTASGVTGTVETSTDQVTVTVHETYEPVILGAVGIGPLHVSATASAHLVRTVGGNRS